MKVAITGTIGSGKSTVLQLLKDKGYPCLSADEINGELLHDLKIQKDIVNRLQLPYFSKHMIRDVIFSDMSKKKQLEDILHPLILNKIQECHLYKDNIQFVEVPLLFESNWDTYFDYSILVYCEEEIAIHRLLQYRGMNEEDARQRIQTQMPVKQKIQKADFCISNNDSVYILQKQVIQVLNALHEKRQ